MKTLLRISLSNDSSLPSELSSSVTRTRERTFGAGASLTKGAERGRSGPEICAGIFLIEIKKCMARYITEEKGTEQDRSVHQCILAILSISEPSSHQGALINSYLLFRRTWPRSHGRAWAIRCGRRGKTDRTWRHRLLARLRRACDWTALARSALHSCEGPR